MRRRSTGTIIQSFKKVLNFAPTSIAAGGNNTYNMVIGDETSVAGQTTATDAKVPTGALVKFIEIQFSNANLVSIASFMHIAIEHLRATQTIVSPNAVGGDPQRNQIHFQAMWNIGKDQNSNRVFRFKIPKKFQRVREGDVWTFVTTCDTIHTAAAQVIYKFYR